MSSGIRAIACRSLLALAFMCPAWLISSEARAQGLGLPGVGNPAMNLPQRQGPMASGGAIGAPGQMNPRFGGPGSRPGQPPGMPGPGPSQSRGAMMMGGARSASAFSGMGRGGGVVRSGQNMSQMSRTMGTNVPGLGNVGGRNR